MSCIGSDLGKVVITTEPTVTNQQINSIIVDSERFDISFVYYTMLILGKELNYISKTSTAVPIVNKSSFSAYEIMCPPLEMQRKIASILSAVDVKIEHNQRINDNLPPHPYVVRIAAVRRSPGAVTRKRRSRFRVYVQLRCQEQRHPVHRTLSAEVSCHE